ncbi:MAG: N-acetylneuraminate synthase family protein [Brevinema sp.]
MYDYLSLLNNRQQPAFLVAEIGINHDGNFTLAKEMIMVAADCRADAVKFQIYEIDTFYSFQHAPQAHELFKKFSLSLEEFYALKEYAEKLGLVCFAAPFSHSVLDNFIKNKVFPIKIASGDATTEPWIDHLIASDVPFIVSCGAMEETEVEALAKKLNGTKAALLYCVSRYPAPYEAFDLHYLDTLQKLLPQQVIGFSDHSQGTALSVAAVARGAKIIERHFTTMPERTDLDHPLSLSPQQFCSMVHDIRAIEKALGVGKRQLQPEEQAVRPHASRSMYLVKAVNEGETITEAHIELLRPGSGVSTEFYRSVVGKKAPKALPMGTNLSDFWRK